MLKTGLILYVLTGYTPMGGVYVLDEGLTGADCIERAETFPTVHVMPDDDETLNMNGVFLACEMMLPLHGTWKPAR